MDLINDRYIIKKELKNDSISSSFIALDKLSGNKFFVETFYLDNFSDQEKESLKEKISNVCDVNLDGFCDIIEITDPKQKNEITILRKYLDGNSLNDIIKLKKNDIVFEQMLFKIIMDIFDVLQNLEVNKISLKYLTARDIRISEDSILNISKGIELDKIDVNLLPIYDILYLAPEILEKKISKNSLIYSLGVMIYQLMTGKDTFFSEDKNTLIELILNENPTLPSLYDFNMDSEIEKIILKCLDKNPENRFSSLSELKNELSKYYESRFVSNKFINSFFKFNRQDSKQISYFNSSIKVDLQKEDEVIQFKNFSNLSLIKSLTDRYDKKLFDSFTEFDKYLQTDEKFGFIFSKNRVFFVHKSIILSGFDSLNNIEIFNNVEMEDLQFLEAIVAKDFLIPIYFYNVLFYKADNNVEIENINTLEQLNNYVLENNLNNSVIKFKSNNLPENYLKKRVLYLGNNIINYLFIKFFVNDFIFERKFNLIDIVLEEFDLILYDYSPEKSDYNIFNYLIQSGKEFLVTANNSFYEEAKESFQNKDIFSFNSLNRELLSFIKENTNLIIKNMSAESSFELYAFYQSNILTNLVLDYKNRLKLFKYQDENFDIKSIKNIDLIMSKITNISSLVNEIIPTLEKTLVNKIIPTPEKTLVNEIIPTPEKTLVNKIHNEILINLYYHKENSYTLANIMKTEEYAYSENLKDKIIDNLNFDHNKVNFDNDTLKLYNYSKFVIENFFFDMIAKSKYNNFPLLLDLISKISRIKINTKFKGQYQSELNIPILIESNDNGIIIVDTGNGSQDDLLRVSEISKHLVNNLKQKVVSTFYICNNNYPSNSIDFYRQEIKAPKIAFFDKLAKIKNIVRLENDKYFHFILVKDENDIMQCLEIY